MDNASFFGKRLFTGILIVLLAAAGGFLIGKKGVGSRQQLVIDNERLSKERSDMAAKYHDLEVDRDNVLAQIKNLLSEKTKWTEAQEALKQATIDNEALTTQKEGLSKDLDKAKKSIEALSSQNDGLKKDSAMVYSKNKVLEHENVQLRAAVSRKVEESPQYQKMTAETKALKDERKRQQGVIKSLEGELKKAQGRIKEVETRDARIVQQLEMEKEDMNALKSLNENLHKSNLELAKTAQEAPKRFSDMANENKRLVKDTADMHYNLGVFYLKNKNFPMAIREFDRALEVDPRHSRAHYNLGYLYAERLEDHEKAMYHFARFLDIDPNSKEADYVRTYLLTRQTYEAKPTR